MSTEHDELDTQAPSPEQDTEASTQQPEQGNAPEQVAYPDPIGEEALEDEGQRGATRKLLDALTEPDAAQAKPEAGTPDAPEKPPEPAKAEAKPPAQDAPPEEEKDLLEAVNSDRGKERVRKVFAENKAMKQEMEGVRDMLGRYDLPPTELAQLMEFGRLTRSANPQDARLALGMLDQQRLALAQRLGVPLPGVDILAEFPDLQQGVQDLRIDPALAHEMARLRVHERMQQQTMQQQTQRAQQSAAFQQQAQQAQAQMESYLQSRSHELDHQARMQALTEHFSDPAKLQAFVQTYSPEQWMPTLQVMYDSIRAPQPAQKPAAQPLRSRPTSLGAPVQKGESSMDRLHAAIANMGIG